MSIRNTDNPSVFFLTSSRGFVLAKRSNKSECSALEVQIFWPLIMYFSPLKTAFVFKESVSDPLFGSVTPKACNLKSPEAIFGRKFDFCFSLPCLKIVPIVYI